MPVLPPSLALTSIAGQISASPLNNDYTAIQTAFNALLGILDDGVAGDVLGGVGTTLAFAKPPGYQYAKDQITVDSASISATTEGTSVAVITGSSVTYDGATEVKIEFWAPNVTVTAIPTRVTFVVYRDATVIGQSSVTITDTTGTAVPKIELHDTPSAGAHTYTVKAFVNANALVVKAGAASGAGTLLKAFLKVTKV